MKFLILQKKFRKSFKEVPLVSVPSSYNHVTEKILQDNGFNIVIYANHMLRASYPAMETVATVNIEKQEI